ncbi:P-II family nitrogen regulator [Pelotomaculum terephthalicicum JT]|uniref:P-II family nitrogen regulator n=1 Tax=Pelotomaculum TaxID=191373 RepID=UPI0009D34A49|nr:MULTISPECIES: P-II family nitrogen regulator [Pelotomaculum]MCG9966707.1 P-II family nitrogen regulator [Pelotomaculum terephthalicicum JT]OPX91434.1 MAG: Nitrogen regulatory protein P-II [Pelotomaculum sp. PtaB.Bin117]OPY62970.1 MAG: Nitrogen regulatory protein P-II [Pelotomaculum sp. PtaU1.Bin065]
MKKIEAVIRPEKLEEVKDALGKYNIHGLTVSQVVGCGLQKGRVGVYRGNEYSINLLPKIKLEIVISDYQAEDVVSMIKEAAYTGAIGDGKIFILPVENAFRIRTGESGQDAL